MKKNKCIKPDCEEKPEYCREHYEALKDSKNKKINILFLLLLFAAGTALILPNIDNVQEVNENKFCFEKVSQHFPEFNFDEEDVFFSWVDNSEGCEGVYHSNKTIQRDGLVLDNQEQGQTIQFKLVDKEDINFIHKDDYNWALIIAGVILIGIFLIFLYGVLTDQL